MAAAAHTSCLWMLALGACVALVVGADCGKECALCVYRLLGQQATRSSVVSIEYVPVLFNKDLLLEHWFQSQADRDTDTFLWVPQLLVLGSLFLVLNCFSNYFQYILKKVFHQLKTKIIDPFQ